ncbi:hypothetical protein PHYC_03491 [Phycisphaerales bacterium]|nr:hypothetical protein PHYC_03491 [Phycisphaerales bacterium]
MDFLTALWLPIVVSAVIVFVASAITWMASPLHKHDYKDPGDKEETILGMLRAGGFAPGVYFVPWCKGAKDKNAETAAKMKQGPWAMLTVMGEPPNFGRSLAMWFVNLLLISLFVAYVAHNAGLPNGANYLTIFRVAGAAAFLGYAGYAIPLSTWHALPWSQLPGRLIDGAIYSVLTAGTFGWLWPDAAAKIPAIGG